MPTRGPCSRTAGTASVSHKERRISAFGECGLDAGAFSVGFSLQSAYSLGRYSSGCDVVQQSPTNAGLAAAHSMSSTPAPFTAIPAAFVGRRPEKFWP